MAIWNNIENRTYIAGEDLSTKQFHFVSMEAGGTVVATGDGAAAIGVLWNAPADTYAASVVVDGSPTVYAGGTIAAGGNVASDAAGKAVAAATSDIILGKAREAAASGQLIQIDIDRGGNVSA